MQGVYLVTDSKHRREGELHKDKAAVVLGNTQLPEPPTARAGQQRLP